MNDKVDLFLSKAKKWKTEMLLLREVILECELKEDFKWMHPCYTYQDSNVVLIHGFKDYCALLFFKGVLLNDKENLLVKQTENVQEGRQIRFTNLTEIVNLKATLQDYLKAAIELEKSGMKVVFKTTADFNMPEEFKLSLEKDEKLKLAFAKLTPGRQRGYLLYFSSAKQAKTRESRIEKYTPKIIAGKGLDD